MHLSTDQVRIGVLLGTVVPVVVVGVLAFGRRAEGDGSARVAGCTDAAIREIKFPGDVTVDEIRVELNGAADAGPVSVRVSAGRFARRLEVTPWGGRVLAFSPGLRGDRFQITLDPSFA